MIENFKTIQQVRQGTKQKILRKSRQVQRTLLQTLQQGDRIENPIFILGCGRSGTTILGKVLGHHPQVTYLNEPREIWINDPQTDIWSSDAAYRKGKLRLKSQDVDPFTAKKTRIDFAVELKLTQKPQLVEKLPANSFRIPYIRQIFPDARFIHMIRNGIEVSHSIATLYAKTGRWFGKDGYKWALLSDYAQNKGKGEFVALCEDNPTLMGLLEWVLSLSTISEDLKALPASDVLEVRYENLLQAPDDTCGLLESFIGLDYAQEMHQFAISQISRQSPKVQTKDITPEMIEIGAELLKKLNYL